MRVKGLTEPRQPIRKHKPVSEANVAEGKVTGTTQAATTLPLSLTPTPTQLFYTWIRCRERGEGKCYLCCKAELMSSRFVRVLSPTGHHTLPTWKNCTEINANNFWSRADVAFCSFSDVMWISKKRGVELKCLRHCSMKHNKVPFSVCYIMLWHTVLNVLDYCLNSVNFWESVRKQTSS